MKGLFAGFQMAFKLIYYHIIIREHPKNDKVVSDTIYITCRRCQNGIYLLGLQQDTAYYLHQIKVCTAILPPCTPSLPLCTAILPPCTPSLPQYSRHVPHHSRYARQYSRHVPQYSRHVPHHSRYARQYSRHVPHHFRNTPAMYPITPARQRNTPAISVANLAAFGCVRF